MRARNIKPGFYTNEELARCSRDARLLVPGLWMIADREGRLEDRPIRIKGQIFPYDAVDVEPLLCELDKFNHIKRYEFGDKKYIQILKFKEHQKPHVNEKASFIPTYSGESGAKVANTCDQGSKHLALNDKSLLLNDECGMMNDKPPIMNDKPQGGFEIKKWDILKVISETTLAKAKKKAPGWDIYNLAKVYNSGVKDRGLPDNPNAAFPAWCANYTKGKQL